MTSLVSPTALKMMGEARETNLTEMYDEVAKKMFGAIVEEFQTSKSPAEVATISFDYADAFMRERYERMSVIAAMSQPYGRN
jgi:hypothetical protein